MAGVKKIRRIVVNCRPIASDAMFAVIDSAGRGIDDIAVTDDDVSAEPLDFRKGGGCLPVSNELALDSTSPPAVSSPFLVVVRFRFPRLVDPSVRLAVLSVVLDFGDVVDSVGSVFTVAFV